MKSILTYVPRWSRCVSAVWRAVEIASSVEQCALYGYCRWSKLAGRLDLMCFWTNFSKHFKMIGGSATGLLSFKQVILFCLGIEKWGRQPGKVTD